MGFKIRRITKKAQQDSSTAPEEPLLTFEEQCLKLAPIQKFTPNLFKGDRYASQELCNFVLTLAFIFNDLKDIIYAHLVLIKSKPNGEFIPDGRWGSYSGIEWHLFRLLCGLFNELFKLIKDKRDLLDDPYLESVIAELTPEPKKYWFDIIAVALSTNQVNDVVKTLKLIRHKVASHYDPECILIGYNDHFHGPDLGVSKIQEFAFASMGTSMAESRFYFADAAGQGYLRHASKTKNLGEEKDMIFKLLSPINFSLQAIVQGFIQQRSAGKQITGTGTRRKRR